MEIIKHGNLTPIRFECKKCGCEFIADITEYKEAYSNGEKHLIVDCPDCNNVAYISEREACFVTLWN
jgi:RNase P subunit RPR2